MGMSPIAIPNQAETASGAQGTADGDSRIDHGFDGRSTGAAFQDFRAYKDYFGDSVGNTATKTRLSNINPKAI
jgi:hypothetical protein